MFAQSTNENIGGTIDKAAQGANGVGHIVLIGVVLFAGVMAIVILAIYFLRIKLLPKSERKAKVLRLP